jgi:hypothetical protein
VSRDGPAGVAVPQTVAEWAALALVAPDSVHLMQAAASPVPDSIGSANLVALGTPDFQQAGPTGWAGKFINLTEDAASEGLSFSSVALYRPDLDDVLALLYSRITASGANSRQLLRLGTTATTVGGGGQQLRPQTTNKVEIRHNGASTISAFSYVGSGAAHPFLLGYDRSNVLGGGAGLLRLNTDKEQLDGGVSLVSTNGVDKGIGGSGTILAPACGNRLYAIWYAAKARAMFAIGLRTVLVRLGWGLAY